jgi:hypothetical protein
VASTRWRSTTGSREPCHAARTATSTRGRAGRAHRDARAGPGSHASPNRWNPPRSPPGSLERSEWPAHPVAARRRRRRASAVARPGRGRAMSRTYDDSFTRTRHELEAAQRDSLPATRARASGRSSTATATPAVGADACLLGRCVGVRLHDPVRAPADGPRPGPDRQERTPRVATAPRGPPHARSGAGCAHRPARGRRPRWRCSRCRAASRRSSAPRRSRVYPPRLAGT